MPGSGTRTFNDSDDYQRGLRQSQIELIITSEGTFNSRVTWVDLGRLYLLRCQEDQPRIAYYLFRTGWSASDFVLNRALRRSGDAPICNPERLHSIAAANVCISEHRVLAFGA